MSHAIDFTAVAQQALRQSQMLLGTWLPGGKFSNTEYSVKNPTRADTNPGSFMINTQTGVWCDFASGDNGMNLIALYAYINGLEYPEAGYQIAKNLGMVVTDADRPESHFKLGKPTATYRYNDSFYIYRFDTKNDKEIRPVSYNNGKWQWKAPETRPLYNLAKIIANPKSEILFCEGEKSVEAATKLFPSHVSTTTSFGAKSPHKTDFAPLANKSVLICPDNDSEGKNYAEKVAKLCLKANVKSIWILQIPDDKPAKFDLADCGNDDYPANWERIKFVYNNRPTKPVSVPKPTTPKTVPVSKPTPKSVDRPTPKKVSVTKPKSASITSLSEQNLSIVWETQDGKTRLLPSIDVALALAPSLTDKLVYDDGVECWLYYKDNYWNITTPKRVFSYVNEIILANRRNVGYGPGLIKNVIEFLEGNRKLQYDKFDDEYSKELIPLKNGVLNINTLELHEHSQTYKFRYILPFNYDAKAKLSLATVKFLDDTCGDDKGKRLLLQATLNRVIKGKRGIQMFTFLEGKPGTGKGTFLNLAQALVGDHNFHTTTLDRLAGKFEFSAIYGKQLVVVPDSKEYIEDLTPINSLVSEDPLTLELKGKNFKMGQANNFKYTGWTIVAANGPIRGGGHKGKSRREVIIKFDTKPKKADTRLFDKLTTAESLSGVFNWCMELTDQQVIDVFMGMDELYPDGLKAKVENLLEADQYAHFLDETYQLDDSHSIKLSVGKAKIEKISKQRADGSILMSEDIVGDDDWISTHYLTYCVEHSIPQNKRTPLNRLSTKLMDTINIFNLDVKKQRVEQARFITGLSPKIDDIGIFSQLISYNDSEKSINDSGLTVINDSESIIKNNSMTVMTVNSIEKNSMPGHSNKGHGPVTEIETLKNTVSTVIPNKHAVVPLSAPLSAHCHNDSENHVVKSLDLLLQVYGSSTNKRWGQLTQYFSAAEIGTLISAGWLKELENTGDINSVFEFSADLKQVANNLLKTTVTISYD